MTHKKGKKIKIWFKMSINTSRNKYVSRNLAGTLFPIYLTEWLTFTKVKLVLEFPEYYFTIVSVNVSFPGSWTPRTGFSQTRVHTVIGIDSGTSALWYDLVLRFGEGTFFPITKCDVIEALIQKLKFMLGTLALRFRVDYFKSFRLSR